MAGVGRRVRVIGPMLALMTLWVLWWNGGLASLPSVTPANADKENINMTTLT